VGLRDKVLLGLLVAAALLSRKPAGGWPAQGRALPRQGSRALVWARLQERG